MIKSTYKIFLGFLLILINFSYSNYANAQNGEFVLPNPLSCDEFGDEFVCVTDKAVDGLFIISIPALAIAVMVAGFQIIGASMSGNAEKAKAGGKTLTYAVVGFIVILFAKSISLVLQSLFS